MLHGLEIKISFDIMANKVVQARSRRIKTKLPLKKNKVKKKIVLSAKNRAILSLSKNNPTDKTGVPFVRTMTEPYTG